ncbi:MAG: uroporphyrinogen-III C-methyltransferase [Pseudomonadota bacterium]
MFRTVAPSGRPPALRRATRGLVSLVGAGPGSADLITLRGLERLRSADICFYDRLVDPALLDHLPARAKRVYVGKLPGGPSWPQARINAALVAAASQGWRTVRLKCGDPGIFARGAEEAAALAAAGLPWESVPGVTAASAAAATSGTFLTVRGKTETLVLATGRLRAGGGRPDWAGHMRPGTLMALYMGVAAAPQIAATLLADGVPATCVADVVSAAGTPGERVLRTSLGALARDLEAAALPNPAIIFLRWPKPQGADQPRSPISSSTQGSI